MGTAHTHAQLLANTLILVGQRPAKIPPCKNVPVSGTPVQFSGTYSHSFYTILKLVHTPPFCFSNTLYTSLLLLTHSLDLARIHIITFK
jgi:hypothetical protein